MMSLAWPLFRVTEQAALAARRKPGAAIKPNRRAGGNRHARGAKRDSDSRAYRHRRR